MSWSMVSNDFERSTKTDIVGSFVGLSFSVAMQFNVLVGNHNGE